MASTAGVLSTVLGTRLRMSLGIRATCAPSDAAGTGRDVAIGDGARLY